MSGGHSGSKNQDVSVQPFWHTGPSAVSPLSPVLGDEPVEGPLKSHKGRAAPMERPAHASTGSARTGLAAADIAMKRRELWAERLHEDFTAKGGGRTIRTMRGWARRFQCIFNLLGVLGVLGGSIFKSAMCAGPTPLLETAVREVDRELPFLIPLASTSAGAATEALASLPQGCEILGHLQGGLALGVLRLDWRRIPERQREISLGGSAVPALSATAPRVALRSAYGLSMDPPAFEVPQQIGAVLRVLEPPASGARLILRASEGLLREMPQGGWQLYVDPVPRPRWIHLGLYEARPHAPPLLVETRAFPCLALSQLAGKSEAGRQIYLRLGDRQLGPFTPDGEGRFSAPIVLAPGDQVVQVGGLRGQRFLASGELLVERQQQGFLHARPLAATGSSVADGPLLFQILSSLPESAMNWPRALNIEGEWRERVQLFPSRHCVYIAVQPAGLAGPQHLHLRCRNTGLDAEVELAFEGFPGPPARLAQLTRRSVSAPQVVDLVLEAYDAGGQPAGLGAGVFSAPPAALEVLPQEVQDGSRAALRLRFPEEGPFAAELFYRDPGRQIALSAGMVKWDPPPASAPQVNAPPREAVPLIAAPARGDNGSPAHHGLAEEPHVFGEPLPAAQSGTRPVTDETPRPARERISLEDRPAGLGRAIEERTLRLGETLRLYAIARDGRGRFLREVSGRWSSTPDIGSIEELRAGREALLTVRRFGSAVAVFDPGAGARAISGRLHVLDDGVRRLSLELAADGSASPLTALELVRGEDRTLHALLRNAVGEFVETTPVAWTVEGSAARVTPTAEGRSAVIAALAEGRARLVARHERYGESALELRIGPAATVALELDLEIQRAAAKAATAGALASRPQGDNAAAPVPPSTPVVPQDTPAGTRASRPQENNATAPLAAPAVPQEPPAGTRAFRPQGDNAAVPQPPAPAVSQDAPALQARGPEGVTHERQPLIFAAIQALSPRQHKELELRLDGQRLGDLRVTRHVAYARPGRDLAAGPHRVEVILAGRPIGAWEFEALDASQKVSQNEAEATDTALTWRDGFPANGAFYSGLPAPEVALLGAPAGAVLQLTGASGAPLRPERAPGLPPTWRLPELADGTYRYEVLTQVGRALLAGTFTLDRVPPTLAIGDWGFEENLPKKSSLRISFTLADAPHDFLRKASLVLRGPEKEVWRLELEDPRCGQHSAAARLEGPVPQPAWLELFGEDGAGNGARVSRLLPATASEEGIAAFDPHPGLVRVEEYAFSGHAIPGAELFFFLDGREVDRQVADSGGRFRTRALPLSYGPNRLELRFHAAGEPVCRAAPLISDTQGPVFFGLMSDRDGVFDEPRPWMELGFRDDFAPLDFAASAVTVDGEPAAGLRLLEDRIAFLPGRDLGEGLHEVSVRARDVLGNESPPETATFLCRRAGLIPARISFEDPPRALPAGKAPRGPSVANGYALRVRAEDARGLALFRGRAGLWADRGQTASTVEVRQGVARFSYAPPDEPGPVLLVVFMGNFPEKTDLDFGGAISQGGKPGTGLWAALRIDIAAPGEGPAALRLRDLPATPLADPASVFPLTVEVLAAGGNLVSAPVPVSGETQLGTLEPRVAASSGGLARFNYRPAASAGLERAIFRSGTLAAEFTWSLASPPLPVLASLNLFALESEIPLGKGSSALIFARARDARGQPYSLATGALRWRVSGGEIHTLEDGGTWVSARFEPPPLAGEWTVEAMAGGLTGALRLRTRPALDQGAGVAPGTLRLDWRDAQWIGQEAEVTIEALLRGTDENAGAEDGALVSFHASAGTLRRLVRGPAGRAATLLRGLDLERDFPLTVWCQSRGQQASLEIRRAELPQRRASLARVLLQPPADFLWLLEREWRLLLYGFDAQGRPAADGLEADLRFLRAGGAAHCVFRDGFAEIKYQLPRTPAPREEVDVESGGRGLKAGFPLPRHPSEELTGLEWLVEREPDAGRPDYELALRPLSASGALRRPLALELEADAGALPRWVTAAQGWARLRYYPPAEGERAVLRARAEGVEGVLRLDLAGRGRPPTPARARVTARSSRYERGLWRLELDMSFEEGSLSEGDFSALRPTQGQVESWRWRSRRTLDVRLALPPGARQLLLHFEGSHRAEALEVELDALRPQLPGFPAPQGDLPTFPRTP